MAHVSIVGIHSHRNGGALVRQARNAVATQIELGIYLLWLITFQAFVLLLQVNLIQAMLFI